MCYLLIGSLDYFFSRGSPDTILVGLYCVCVDSLTDVKSLCHDGALTHKPVLFPHLEVALTKIKVLPQNTADLAEWLTDALSS